MALARYILRRLIFVVPQLLGILMVGFFLVKLIPGDPAVLMLGPNATPESVAALRSSLGLDQSIVTQFGVYIGHVLRGDLGISWQSTRPVLDDLLERFPATLELVTLGLALALVIGVPLGIASASERGGPVRRAGDLYGLLAGAIPDFWLALVMIYLFYSVLGIAPPPLGRMDIALSNPPFVTGSMILDSLLAGDWEALHSVLSHLVLPVVTLGLINAGPILKVTQSTMLRVQASDFIRYAETCGLPRKVVRRQAIRASLPSVVTIVSVLYGFLIGGAVLVEIVFSWGGAGQYAVQAVLNADINPVLGFVVFSAVFSLVVYLLVDLAYFMLDPRTRG